MKAQLVFVPPGGGEADYHLDFELPGVPQPGDYIIIERPGQTGTEDFIVRRTWWFLAHPNPPLSAHAAGTTCGSVRAVMVECEFARGAFSSEAHAQACKAYDRPKGNLREFETTAY